MRKHDIIERPAPFMASLGTYAVLGNRDGWQDRLPVFTVVDIRGEGP